jgi:hypothetical protein
MSDLIVNANAPKVKIEIEVDYRFAPERIQMKTSQVLPVSILSKVFVNCMGTLLDEQIKGEARAADYNPAKDDQTPKAAPGVANTRFCFADENPPNLPEFPEAPEKI